MPACYYCVVHASNSTIQQAENYDKENRSPVGYHLEGRKNAYQMAIANEKLKLFKISDFITGSKKLIPVR